MKTFIIINLAGIGDVLVTSQLCADIKKYSPDSRLIFITSKISYEIAKYIPGVDKVYIFDKKQKNKGLWGMLKFISEVKERWNIDCSIAINSYERGDILALLLGAKTRISEKGKPTSLLCTKLYPFRPEDASFIHRIDIVSNFFSIITNQMPDKNSDISYIIPDEAKNFAKEFIKENGLEGIDIIGLNPTSTDDEKDWKPEQAAEFIKLINICNKKVIITGTQKAAEFCQKLKDLGCYDFIDLSNKTSIIQLAGIIDLCRVFVSVDTGSMHISIAIKKPTLALFFIEKMIKVWGPKDLNRHMIMFNPDGIDGKECFYGVNKLFQESNSEYNLCESFKPVRA